MSDTLTPKQAASKTPDLPPAGHKRDELLKQRTDTLAEQVATAPEGGGTVPLMDFDIEREIASAMGYLEVKDAKPGWKYKWVQERHPTDTPGIMVESAQVQGWQIVQGTDEECKGRRDARGYRVIGDCVLMKTTEENYAKIQRYDAELRRRRELGVTSQLEAMAAKRGMRVMPISDLNPQAARVMESRFRGAQAAQQQFEASLRDGTLSGVKPGGY